MSGGDPERMLLAVEGLSVHLGGRRVLESISLRVEEGEFLGIIGPNGGGKTTLLRALLGLVQPTEGRVTWADGEGAGRAVGYVPQRSGVDPNNPVGCMEVVKQGWPGGWPVWGERARALEREARVCLDRVGLGNRAGQPFVELSGGQQRRLLLARALLARPAVVLLDEPTAGVDSAGQEGFCRVLRELSRAGIAILLVSHDIPLITEYADRIACVSVGLHWHGAARALEAATVRAAYCCELAQYQIRRGPGEGCVVPGGGEA